MKATELKLASMLCIFLAIMHCSNLYGQTQTTVSGTIKDHQTGDPLVGVNVTIKGKVIGTVSDYNGNFNLRVNEAPPFTLQISIVGYASQELQITNDLLASQKIEIRLKEQVMLGQEVVISASRVEENILKSPVQIEKMDILAIRETPAANFYEGLRNLKSVDMVNSSLSFPIINTRGFAGTGNTRFVQVIDGMDNQAPGLNFPAANLVGMSELDAESVELIPGSASALYGPNAFNGILLMTSKNPFQYQGLSAMVKTGVNHVDNRDTNISPMFEGAIRYAKAFNNKLAFKVNATYMQAEDWHATDYRDRDPGRPTDGSYNPAFDGLNLYGDEIVTNLSGVGLPGLGRVARTGYEERDLVDYNVKNIKLDAALHYRINDKVEAILHSKYGAGTTVYQGANRYSLANFNMQQHKLEFKGSNFFLRGYATLERSGDSYDSRFLAWNLNRTWKSDAQWFQEYAMGYGAALQGGAEAGSESAHSAARAFADRGRLVPGTPEFEKEKKRIASTTDFREGAKFNDQTNLYHAEGQYQFDKIEFVDILVGGSYRLYDLGSNGTIFGDTTGNNITIQELGAFVQASKRLLNDKLKATVSGRYDKNENFQGRFNPRASLVFSPTQSHNFRGSYQTGFRNPTTQDQFIFLNIGPAILVGGLPVTSRGLNVYENSFTVPSVQRFVGLIQADIAAGMDASQAVVNRKGVLEKSDVAYIQPEQVQSFEIGYKGLLFNNKLMVDVNYYYSSYTNFILNTTVLRVNNQILNEDGTISSEAAFDIVNNSSVNPTSQAFQLYTNAKDNVSAQGASLGLTYSLPKGYTISGNGTWAELNLANANANEIPAFNTPRLKTNLSFGNRNVVKNIGFNVTYRWQEAFEWVGSFNSLIPGEIPAFSMIDAQVSYKMKSLKSILKVGGQNITNKRVSTAFGAPQVGGVYYVSLTFDELLN
jgi:iron complex outermembrane recepter protein